MSGADEALPMTPDEIVALAAARDLRIPAACMPGVAANLALLATHAARLRGGRTRTAR